LVETILSSTGSRPVNPARHAPRLYAGCRGSAKTIAAASPSHTALRAGAEKLSDRRQVRHSASWTRNKATLHRECWGPGASTISPLPDATRSPMGRCPETSTSSAPLPPTRCVSKDFPIDFDGCLNYGSPLLEAHSFEGREHFLAISSIGRPRKIGPIPHVRMPSDNRFEPLGRRASAFIA
jgi:hypothetical protein